MMSVFLHVLRSRTASGKLFMIASSNASTAKAPQAQLIQVDTDRMKAYTEACETLLGIEWANTGTFKVSIPAVRLLRIDGKQNVVGEKVPMNIQVSALGQESIAVEGMGRIIPTYKDSSPTPPGIIDLPTTDYEQFYSTYAQSKQPAIQILCKKANVGPPPEGTPLPYGCDKHTFESCLAFLTYAGTADKALEDYIWEYLDPMVYSMRCTLKIEFDPRDVTERVRKAYGLH